MSSIAGKFTEKARQFGYKIKAIDARHLAELRETIETLLRDGLIDKRLCETYLRFDYVSKSQLNVKTVFIVAMPHPITRLGFEWHGKIISVDIPPTYFAKAYDFRAHDILNGLLTPAGYKTEKANLPLKTLAVKSGLARYGRNNVTYVPRMGSFHRLLAFYSDCPSDEDSWNETKAMKACDKCRACLENCPTQCIAGDRFLVHAEKCLTFFNEDEQNIPDWIPEDSHNALVGCMRCQLVCPVNKPYLHNIETGHGFTEGETTQILNRVPVEKLAEGTRRKLEHSFTEEMYPLLPRNLGLLINR